MLNLEAPVICLGRIALSLSHKNQSFYEFSKLSGNGPRISDQKDNDLNVKYKSIAISRKNFEELVEKNYKIVFRMDHGVSKAHQAAAISEVSLVSYVAVFNPNPS